MEILVCKGELVITTDKPVIMTWNKEYTISLILDIIEHMDLTIKDNSIEKK